MLEVLFAASSSFSPPFARESPPHSHKTSPSLEIEERLFGCFFFSSWKRAIIIFNRSTPTDTALGVAFRVPLFPPARSLLNMVCVLSRPGDPLYGGLSVGFCVDIFGRRLRGWGCGEGLHAGWRQPVPGLGHVDGYMRALLLLLLAF